MTTAIDWLKTSQSQDLDSKCSLTPPTGSTYTFLSAAIPNLPGATIEINFLITGLTSYSTVLVLGNVTNNIVFPTALTGSLHTRMILKHGSGRTLWHRTANTDILYTYLDSAFDWSGTPTLQVRGRFEGAPLIVSANVRLLQ